MVNETNTYHNNEPENKKEKIEKEGKMTPRGESTALTPIGENAREKDKAVYTTAPVTGGWAGAVMSWAGAEMIWAGA